MKCGCDVAGGSTVRPFDERKPCTEGTVGPCIRGGEEYKMMGSRIVSPELVRGRLLRGLDMLAVSACVPEPFEDVVAALLFCSFGCADGLRGGVRVEDERKGTVLSDEKATNGPLFCSWGSALRDTLENGPGESFVGGAASDEESLL